jgi:hypothetical protein
MCAKFSTEMDRMRQHDNLKKSQKFERDFLEHYFEESKVILLMTNSVPEKRPTAQTFLDKSPEHSCWHFEMKMGLKKI